MNTVGKILVILNFLFAVAVGALIVVVVGLGTNWKEKYQSLEREAIVLRDSRGIDSTVSKNVVNDYKTLELQVEGFKQKILVMDIESSSLKEKNDQTIADMLIKLKDSDLTLDRSNKTMKRQVEEIGLLKQFLKDRESSIVKLQDEVGTYRVTASSFESMAKDRQIKNENLLIQIQELTRALAKRDSGANSDIGVIRNPNDPNPPAVVVNGKVEKVADNLVEISLGTDHGLAKNNTLDVYRLTPEPKYLGMVRIQDAGNQKSVGRLISSSTSARTQLREGDLVTSKLTK